MSDQPGTLVALCTYNEVKNLPSLVETILRILPTADLLVVDDNSPDGTGRWCDQNSERQPRLDCLHRPAKQGLGSATLSAMQYAIQHDYDVVITLDADWSHDPTCLPGLLAGTQRADVVIGSRYVSGGAIEGWPLGRRLVSRVLNAFSRRTLRLPISDASGACRAYRVAQLRELELSDVQATGYAYLEELLWHLRRSGASFAEIPITFRQRREGHSKADWREAWGKIAMLVRLGWRG